MRPLLICCLALLACQPEPRSPTDAGRRDLRAQDLAIAPDDLGKRDLGARDLSALGGDLKAGADLAGCAADNDGDGYSPCDGDCDDYDPKSNPKAAEICNGIDDNCNGMLDEGFDVDADGWTTCAGDCNDGDAKVHPKAALQCDGKDSNCDGKPDNATDGDGDGYAVCDDCDDGNAGVNKGAFEVEGDKIDNDCDGVVDEKDVCDGQLPTSSADLLDYARAMELCAFVTKATFPSLPSGNARAIAPDFGLYKPRAGKNMLVLSTGRAADEDDTAFVGVDPGSDFRSRGVPNPLPQGNVTCVDQQGRTKTFADPATVNDLVEYRIEVQVPTNAVAFSFDFNFMTAEYPEYVCTKYNDKLLVILDSKSTKGNISFDAKGQAVTVNNGFFSVTSSWDLTGTGMDGGEGGGTGWLTTTVAVSPGEKITLRFIMFDEGDNILDSTVLLDAFRWTVVPACATPTTGRTDGGSVPCDGGTT